MQWKRFQGRFYLAPNQTTGKHTSTCKTAALPQTEQTHGSAGGPAHAAGGGAGGGPQTSPAVPIKPIPIRERPAFLGALLDEKEPVLKFVDANFNRHCSPTDRRKYPCYELKLDALLAEYPKLVFTAHATQRARGTDNQEGRDNVLAVKRCLTRGGGMPVTFKPVAFRRERPGEEGRFNLQFNDCMCCCAFRNGTIRVITVLPIRINWSEFSTGSAKRSKQAQMLMAPVPENAAPDREMTISEDCVGHVIGKKGATLERVRQKSAATVKVEVGATATKVKFYGPPGAVRTAAKMVAELVKYAKASTKTAGQQRQQPSANGKSKGKGKGKGSSPPARVLTKGDKAKARAAELEARQKERTRSAARAAASAAKAAADAAKASKAGKRKAKGKAKLAKSG